MGWVKEGKGHRTLTLLSQSIITVHVALDCHYAVWAPLGQGPCLAHLPFPSTTQRALTYTVDAQSAVSEGKGEGRRRTRSHPLAPDQQQILPLTQVANIYSWGILENTHTHEEKKTYSRWPFRNKSCFNFLFYILLYLSFCKIECNSTYSFYTLLFPPLKVYCEHLFISTDIVVRHYFK